MLRLQLAAEPIGGYALDWRFIRFAEQSVREFAYRPAMHARQIGIRVERGPWHQYDGPLPGTWVGQGELAVFRFDTVVVDDVKIKRTTGPMRFPGAPMGKCDSQPSDHSDMRPQCG